MFSEDPWYTQIRRVVRNDACMQTGSILAGLPCDEANGRMTVDTEKSGSWEEPGETRDEVWTVLGT